VTPPGAFAPFIAFLRRMECSKEPGFQNHAVFVAPSNRRSPASFSSRGTRVDPLSFALFSHRRGKKNVPSRSTSRTAFAFSVNVLIETRRSLDTPRDLILSLRYLLREISRSRNLDHLVSFSFKICYRSSMFHHQSHFTFSLLFSSTSSINL